MKTCNQCFKEKPLDDFYKQKTTKDGYFLACKECTKARVRKHRAENIDRVREYDRERGLRPERKEKVAQRRHRYASKKEAYMQKYTNKYPEKYTARNIFNAAIRDGKLTPQPCEHCGSTIKIHGHHEDYSKPLDVVWLCPPCHGARHREINAERRKKAA